MEGRGTTLEGPNLIFYPIVNEYREGKVKRPLGCEKNMKPHAFPPRMHKLVVFVTLYLLHNGPVTSSSEQAKLWGVRRSESESAPILVEIFLRALSSLEETRSQVIYPWASWSLPDTATEGWTHACSKRRGWPVGRGERLIKRGDSWFSAKAMYVTLR